MAHTAATILIDTRERIPLLFPRIVQVAGQGRIIHTERATLKTGDYALKAAPLGCLIERKGSISEIITNMLDPADRARQLRAFDRLALAAYPILLIEQTPATLLTPIRGEPRDNHGDPALAIDRLLDETFSRRISLWFVGACNTPDRRIRVGELVLRALLSFHERTRLCPPPTDSVDNCR